MRRPIYEQLSVVYDHDWGRWSRQYTALIRNLLQQRGISRARILDLACGTGTLAVQLGEAGHSVLGVDISPMMIEVAIKKAARLSNISFQVADMTAFSTGETFDCVTCTYDSLNYLHSPDQVQAAVTRVGRALESGGSFIFDITTDRMYLTRHKGTHSRELGGQSFLQKLHYDSVRRIATTIFSFPDGTEEVHTQRPYTLDEIRPVLESAGLTIRESMSGFGREPYTSESERLFCIATKEA